MSGRDRNKPCECGSGVKWKRCLCREVTAAHEEAIREDDSRAYLKRMASYAYRRRVSNNLALLAAMGALTR